MQRGPYPHGNGQFYDGCAQGSNPDKHKGWCNYKRSAAETMRPFATLLCHFLVCSCNSHALVEYRVFHMWNIITKGSQWRQTNVFINFWTTLYRVIDNNVRLLTSNDGQSVNYLSNKMRKPVSVAKTQFSASCLQHITTGMLALVPSSALLDLNFIRPYLDFLWICWRHNNSTNPQ